MRGTKVKQPPTIEISEKNKRHQIKLSVATANESGNTQMLT
jgi:hypothetical protein